MNHPRIGITLGDPRGIGPEVVRKALAAPDLRAAAEWVLIGPTGTEIDSVHHPIGRWEMGDGAEVAGALAGRAIEEGIRLALDGEIGGLVTAPIDKAALRAGGWHFPGHTEMLRELTGAASVGMMMCADRTLAGSALRVVLATTHVALRDVPDALSVDLLVEQTLLTRDALRGWWAIEEPRIALCAVNPHGSDGGLFGDEEARIVEPARQLLHQQGCDVHGPIPADTVFTRALRGEYDAVVAPYHDVGMAAFKTAAFGSGVNATLGLPFPRTSPDHGTAIDIAGRGIADPSSMKEALRLAARLARHFDRATPIA